MSAGVKTSTNGPDGELRIIIGGMARRYALLRQLTSKKSSENPKGQI
jgi:hypothetical protein